MSYSLLDKVEIWEIFIPRRLELLKTHHCVLWGKYEIIETHARAFLTLIILGIATVPSEISWPLVSRKPGWKQQRTTKKWANISSGHRLKKDQA